MTAVNSNDDLRRGAHILAELEFGLVRRGDELHGSAPVTPEMFVPGTNCLRTSVLATWADTASGYAVMAGFAPRVPVTLDLDVHVYAPLRDLETINAVARLLKAGRSVAVVTVEFNSGGGRVALATASFMAAPNPAVTMPPGLADLTARPHRSGRLRVPLAERARCEIREPGVAVLPRSDDGLNASNTVNGGLIALAIEEAALSLTPGATLASMAMRYLRPVRVGPAVASAEVRAGLGSVEVRDAGSDDRLAVYALTKTFESSP